jgi:hypothetical protein
MNLSVFRTASFEQRRCFKILCGFEPDAKIKKLYCTIELPLKLAPRVAKNQVYQAHWRQFKSKNLTQV